MTAPHTFYPNSDTTINETLDENGKRHNVYAAFYPDDMLIEAIQYDHGIRHGPYVRNYSMDFGAAMNFSINGFYGNDKKVGVWIATRPNADWSHETVYAKTFYKKDGSEIGVRLIFDDGENLCSIEAVREGKTTCLTGKDPLQGKEKEFFAPAVNYLFEMNKGHIIKGEDLFAMRKLFLRFPAFPSAKPS